MRIGVRSAVSGLVLASIIVSAVGVHLLWWRTAQQISQTLADTINDQIVSAVGDELQSITTETKSAFTAVRTLLVENVIDARDANKREFVFLSQLQAQPTISWVAFGFPDRSFFAAHKLGNTAIEMLDIAGGEPKLRIDQYELDGMDVAFKDRRLEPTNYSVTDQEWYRDRRVLEKLLQRLIEAGLTGSLFIILSHGGMAPVEEAARLAAATVLSGPAGGMSGGQVPSLGGRLRHPCPIEEKWFDHATARCSSKASGLERFSATLCCASACVEATAGTQAVARALASVRCLFSMRLKRDFILARARGSPPESPRVYHIYAAV